jgi:hypothetical protein
MGRQSCQVHSGAAVKTSFNAFPKAMLVPRTRVKRKPELPIDPSERIDAQRQQLVDLLVEDPMLHARISACVEQWEARF